MASQVQYRRGTNAQNAAFTGALAEITVDTTNGTLRVHDAITVGGSNIATVAYVTSQISALSANSITNGTSSVAVIASGGNIRANVGGSTVQTISTGLVEITGAVSATGNVSGGNLNVTGNIVDTGAMALVTGASGNVSLAPNGSIVVAVTTTGANVAGTLTATGNVTGGNLATAGIVTVNSGNISGTVLVNAGGNGVGNIGSASGYFNTAHVKATSAQYADVAEKYVADQNYEPGTVVEIGGSAEVTMTTQLRSTKIAGVVSTNPAFVMNSCETDPNAVDVALLGRVPCRVVGTINKGDILCSSHIPGVATADSTPTYGSIVGKALEQYNSNEVGIIEVLVGRL